METTVIIALGSNRRHGRHGAPSGVLEAAMAALSARGVHILRRSRILSTAPLGPSDRRFANAVVIAVTTLSANALLAELQSIERAFGRRRYRRWGARVLDLDIVAYGGEVLPSRLRWRTGRGFVVPHRAMHQRRFVLDPMAEVASGWRHPILGRNVRQMRARLIKPRSID